MKRLWFGAGLALVLLAGCTTAELQRAGADTADAVRDVAAVCQQAPALIAAADAQAPAPTSAAGILLADAKASCTADGAVAATLAPKVDGGTPDWLKGVLNGLAVASQLAGVVAPLI